MFALPSVYQLLGRGFELLEASLDIVEVQHPIFRKPNALGTPLK